MGFDTKNISKVNGGYRPQSGIMGNPFAYITGGLSGQDGTGFNPTSKATMIAENIRAETSDTLKRRSVGFRGL